LFDDKRLDNENNLREKLNLTKLMKGNFKYNSMYDDIVFKKDTLENNLRTTNVASGIKAFGIIDMLLQVEAVKEGRLLILDEPENHLHPAWQVEYAKLLVKLAKEGVPILITSHNTQYRFYRSTSERNI